MAYTKYTETRFRAVRWARENYWPQGTLLGESKLAQWRGVPSTISGVYLPNWKHVISLGGNATTDMSAVEFKHLAPIVPFRHKHFLDYQNGQKYMCFIDDDGEFVQSPATTDNLSLIATARNKAKQKLVRKLSASFKGFTFLGELRESIGMIRNPAESLRREVGRFISRHQKGRQAAYRRSNKSGEQYTKTIADSWLEYSFGWAPLVSDIKDAVGAFRAASERPCRETFRVESKVDGSVTGGASTSGYSTLNWQTIWSTKHSSSCRIAGAINNSCSLSTNFAAEYGIFPAEIVPAAWELVPWSFLVDYFVNIGDVLDAWATFRRINLAWACQTERKLAETRTVRKHYMGSSNPKFLKVIYTYPGKSHVLHKTVTRTKLVTLTPPSFEFRTKLSDSKFLNIAALLEGKRSDITWKRTRGL